MTVPQYTNNVVKNSLCIGCGVCAGVCPQSCLKIRFNKYGEYRPYLSGVCTDCGLCRKVCPFIDSEWDEDALAKERFEDVKGIQHNNECGYYLNSYVGGLANDEKRIGRSSGGLASWFLSKLLQRNEVDAVICVVNTGVAKNPFSFALLETPEEIFSGSKSCYYPVELSDIIKRILAEEKRYAMIGLPCFLKGVQKAAKYNKKIKDRIKVYAGLICGQLKSRFFAEYLCRSCGEKGLVSDISFREKEMDKPALQYIFKAGVNKEYFQGGAFGRAFCEGWFKIPACNYCDDIFAECSDVAFMDAWLPEYIPDPLGTSLVISRVSWINRLFELKQKELSVHSIDIQKVVSSQQGGVENKRVNLAKRLSLFAVENRKTRVKPVKIGFRQFFSLITETIRERLSKVLWRRLHGIPRGLFFFNNIMKGFDRVISFPFRIYRKLFK